jgi:hypothetical protein
MRLGCHLANTTPGSIRKLAQIRQRSAAAKRLAPKRIRPKTLRTQTDAAGVPPCEHNTRFHSQPGTNTSTVSRRDMAGAKAHPAQNPPNINRCGWSATLRTQHQVPFANWHKYVNGQPQVHGWREEGVHKPGLFTLREQAQIVKRVDGRRKRPVRFTLRLRRRGCGVGGVGQGGRCAGLRGCRKGA